MSYKKINLPEVRDELKKEGYAIFKFDDDAVHAFPYDSPWLDDIEFNKLYHLIRKNTLVDRTRCYSLYLLMKQIQKIQGDILEVGVWRGGTAGIFAKMAPTKTVYLADTFQGVVKSTDWEHYKDKRHSDTSIELVTDFLNNDLKVTNYSILSGTFPEMTGHLVKDIKFSFVHIDVDVYFSAKDTFNFIWDKLSKNGIVAFDDYGFISACIGVYKFVNEIKDDEDKIFIQNLNGHCYIIKRF